MIFIHVTFEGIERIRPLIYVYVHDVYTVR
jgi:hypothetical protein